MRSTDPKALVFSDKSQLNYNPKINIKARNSNTMLTSIFRLGCNI